MISPVNFMTNFSNKSVNVSKNKTVQNTNLQSKTFQMRNNNQVSFSGRISYVRDMLKLYKKIPESMNPTEVTKRLTMPKELLNHNWELVELHQNSIQTVYDAIKNTNTYYVPEADKKVSEVLNNKHFNPYMKVKIPALEKPVNLLDIFSGHEIYATKQNFPSDILLKVLGEDGTITAQNFEKLVNKQYLILSVGIMDNFRYRFMNQDIKKEEPKIYKKILTLYNKCLEKRYDFNTMNDAQFESSIDLASREGNVNYLKMISDLNIPENEQVSGVPFENILHRAAEAISPTPIEIKRTSIWWNKPSYEEDSKKINSAYLNSLV